MYHRLSKIARRKAKAYGFLFHSIGVNATYRKFYFLRCVASFTAKLHVSISIDNRNAICVCGSNWQINEPDKQPGEFHLPRDRGERPRFLSHRTDASTAYNELGFGARLRAYARETRGGNWRQIDGIVDSFYSGFRGRVFTRDVDAF